MAIARLPLVGITSARDKNTNTDQRFINCFPEIQGSKKTQSQDTSGNLKQDDNDQVAMVVKRAGLVSQNSETAAAGRGIFSWGGNIYAVIGNKVYKDGTAASTTLDTSSGRVYADISDVGSGHLILHDGSNIYTHDGTDITKLTDGDIPSSIAAGIVFLDGYIFVAESGTDTIHNSELNAALNDDGTDFQGDSIDAEIKADDVVAIARHINYVVAFGTDTMEVFYDAANTSGSPLSRLKGTQSLAGCAAGASVVNFDTSLYWVAQSEGGSPYVAKMEGLHPKRVSNIAVEKSLDGEGSNISSAYGFPVRVQGHAFYVLTLPTTGKITWVYDTEQDTWHEWTSFNGSTETYFTGVASVRHSGEQYILDEDNGKYYTLDPDTYQDDSNTIKVAGFTEKFDGGVFHNKFLHRLTVVGDQDGTDGTDLKISYSDDDYATFSTARTVDLNDEQPQLTRLGSFKRRAFKYTFENNRPMRLEAFELNVRQGHYAQ